MADFIEHDANDQQSPAAGESAGAGGEDARFTSYNVRLQDSLKKARLRQQDSSAVIQLPGSKPAKTDSYAGRLKSQLRRIRERLAGDVPTAAAEPATPRVLLDDPCADQGCTD